MAWKCPSWVHVPPCSSIFIISFPNHSGFPPQVLASLASSFTDILCRDSKFGTCSRVQVLRSLRDAGKMTGDMERRRCWSSSPIMRSPKAVFKSNVVPRMQEHGSVSGNVSSLEARWFDGWCVRGRAHEWWVVDLHRTWIRSSPPGEPNVEVILILGYLSLGLYKN